ncbi:hypothetical protein, partial [Streptomyces adustus]|uniref:hypothetical protein n=1 Tax=Streptomyces adustus TaxID=1609272 RepID=UPI001EE45445
ERDGTAERMTAARTYARCSLASSEQRAASSEQLAWLGVVDARCPDHGPGWRPGAPEPNIAVKVVGTGNWPSDTEGEAAAEGSSPRRLQGGWRPPTLGWRSARTR